MKSKSEDPVAEALDRIARFVSFRSIVEVPKRSRIWNYIWWNLARNAILMLIAFRATFDLFSESFPPFVFLPALLIFLTWDSQYGLLVHLPRKWTVSHPDLVAAVDTRCVRSGDSYFVFGLLIYFAGHHFRLETWYWLLSSAGLALLLAMRMLVFWIGTPPFVHQLKDQGSLISNVREAYNVIESWISRHFTSRISFPITLFLLRYSQVNGTFISTFSVCVAAVFIWAGSEQQRFAFAGALILVNFLESIAGGLTRARLADSYFSRWWVRLTGRVSEFLILMGLSTAAILQLGYKDGSFWLGASVVMATFAWTEDSMYTITGMILERPLKQPVRMWRFQWKSAKLSTQLDPDWTRYILAGVIVAYDAVTAIVASFLLWTFIAWGRGRKLTGKDESW